MAKKKKKSNKTALKVGVAIGVVAVIAIVVAVLLAIFGSTPSVSIEYSSESKTAKIVIDGEEQDITGGVATVESIDNSKAQTDTEDVDAGRGWWVDISTPETFENAIIGQCVDVDGYYGSQCFDTANLFWQNYTGRSLSSCGTGAAKGTLNCWEQNAGSEFDMVWDATQLRPGDIVVFKSGQWGHIGMAMGYYNNGYITLLGTNQGGSACSGGGSTANIINISLSSFGGAFRPKGYNHLYEVKEEAKEEAIPVSGCTSRYVEKGDTMSKYMLECENTVVYGAAMDAYAKTWFSTVIKPGQSVYDGWHSPSGVGLYYTDTVEHRF